MTSIILADYSSLVAESAALKGEELVSLWTEQLPYYCRDEYLTSTLRPTEIVRIKHGTFEYIFDHYTLHEANGTVPYTIWEEDRLILVCGRSCKPTVARRRDDARLRSRPVSGRVKLPSNNTSLERERSCWTAATRIDGASINTCKTRSNVRSTCIESLFIGFAIMGRRD